MCILTAYIILNQKFLKSQFFRWLSLVAKSYKVAISGLDII